MMDLDQVNIRHGLAVDTLNDLLQTGELGRCFTFSVSVVSVFDLNCEIDVA